MANDGILLTREQLNVWTGRELTDAELDQLEESIPNSSIPDAISTIVDAFEDEDEDEDEE